MGDRTLKSLSIILHSKAIEDESLREAIEALRSEGQSVEVYLCWEAANVARFARDARVLESDVVVAGGGDGMLNAVLNELYTVPPRYDGAMAVLPYGTGNDYAEACGIQVGDPLRALQIAANVTPTPIDVGSANGKLFVNVASGGYGAEVTATTSSEVKGRLGRFSYFLAGIAQMEGMKARHVTIRGQGFAWEGPMLGVAIANGRQAGGGFKLAPQAVIDDGYFDVVICPEISLLELTVLVGLLRNGQPSLENTKLLTRQTPWLQVESDQPFHFNLDGEPLQHRSFRFNLLPRHIAFCIPDTAPLLHSQEAASGAEQTS
jgi:lipid kinase YegS